MNIKRLGSRAAVCLAAMLCFSGAAAMQARADQAGGAAGAGAAAGAPAANAAVPAVSATIQSCVIASDQANVQIQVAGSGDMAGTDGNYYLFELQPYQDAIGGRTDYIGAAPGGAAASFTVPLNRGTPADRLYSKFVVAVFDGSGFRTVSQPHYITNPEAVAGNRDPFEDPLTKKGLRIEIDMMADAFDLGVKHVGTDIAFHQILGSGIDYEYDGKMYHFNKDVIENYDKTISALSGKSMTVTAIILNEWNDATPDLVYPGIKKTSNPFYLFNTSTQAGFEQTRAIASFLAERYDGSNPNYGKISNWIIGNEINNQYWNYIGPMDVIRYTREYQRAFRVFYTAIKSASANDRVYFSIDYNWMNEINGTTKYGGREVVDYFNSLANTEGQMDWGLAYHPYPHPMTEPEFWDDGQTGLFTQDFNSPIINFNNLHVLTDYFTQSALRAPSGEVRHIILTEEGFTAQSASKGYEPDVQAAAFAYSYYLVDSNPYIDAYILSRQVDAPSEAAMGLKFGLWECDMTKPDRIVATRRRKIWQVFRDIDKKKDTLESSEFAKAILGIQKWSDIIPNFKWRALE